MPHLSLSLLGALQVTLDGQQAAAFKYEQIRALLVYLVSEADRPHRREALGELLWPDQRGNAALDSLRTALSNLRHVIGDHGAEPPFLIRRRKSLQFNRESNYTLDVTTFTDLILDCQKHVHDDITACPVCIERLQKAAELYRGPFLDQFTLPDSEEFENWLTFKRTQLASQALTVLQHLLDFEEKQGAFDRARRYAWRQLELEPWHEQAHRRLMYLLAIDGQRNAALAQYEHCCRILEEEMALSPSAETTALYEQIRAGEIAPIVLPQRSAAPIERQPLPIPPTRFIGREKEIARLYEKLADPACRLLTIVGPGGMGKTRLALQAAQQLEGAYFIPLTTLSSGDFLVAAIAETLHFTSVSQENLAAQLKAYLRDKTLILILDNFEHLVAESGLLLELLNAAPAVKILVTSRERLNLPGEHTLELAGMPITGSTEDAIQLFVECARMSQDRFTLSSDVWPAVQRICQLVEGMPLGIELAAAWARMLSCNEIADNIASNLEFLTAKTRNIPARHRSLRAVFEYSWNSLSAEEQSAFGALSVFRGGFQADAALPVAGASLPVLLSLRDKSIVARSAEGRYEIHELLRQYAHEKLVQVGEVNHAKGRHLDFFCELAQTAEPKFFGAEQIPWLERMDTENDNLRAALDWALSDSASERGLRLAGALWFFWHQRQYAKEGREWLEKLLAAEAGDSDKPTHTPELIRMKALFAAGWLAQDERNMPRAVQLSEGSLAIARRLGDRRGTAYPLSTLAWLAYFAGNYDQAVAFGTESLGLFREVNDSWGIVHTLNILGYIAEVQGDYASAELLDQEGILLARRAGDQDALAWSSYLLSRVALAQGNHEQALELCQTSFAIYHELNNNWGKAVVLYTIGDVAFASKDYERAVEFCEESIARLREMGDYWVIAAPLNTLALIAYDQGDDERARVLAQESLIYFRQVGDRRGITHNLNLLGMLANRPVPAKTRSGFS